MKRIEIRPRFILSSARLFEIWFLYTVWTKSLSAVVPRRTIFTLLANILPLRRNFSIILSIFPATVRLLFEFELRFIRFSCQYSVAVRDGLLFSPIYCRGNTQGTVWGSVAIFSSVLIPGYCSDTSLIQSGCSVSKEIIILLLSMSRLGTIYRIARLVNDVIHTSVSYEVTRLSYCFIWASLDSLRQWNAQTHHYLLCSSLTNVVWPASSFRSWSSRRRHQWQYSPCKDLSLLIPEVS
jgi:hypothetical protein